MFKHFIFDGLLELRKIAFEISLTMGHQTKKKEGKFKLKAKHDQLSKELPS